MHTSDYCIPKCVRTKQQERMGRKQGTKNYTKPATNLCLFILINIFGIGRLPCLLLMKFRIEMNDVFS